MTDHLLRKYAPTPATGWQQIDAEAKERVTGRLAARRLVGWSTGRGPTAGRIPPPTLAGPHLWRPHHLEESFSFRVTEPDAAVYLAEG